MNVVIIYSLGAGFQFGFASFALIMLIMGIVSPISWITVPVGILFGVLFVFQARQSARIYNKNLVRR